MNKDITEFLELKRMNPTLTSMDTDCRDILFNLEILFDNKLDLDAKYHEPKQFVTSLNNFARNIAFIIEKAKESKSKYPWLYASVNRLIATHQREVQIVKKLRDNSVHQELLIPEGAFSVGLFRITSGVEYKYKLGFGDKSDIRNLPGEYIFSSTSSIFMKLLQFHFLTFIDIEHSSLNECLSISRSWFIKAKFKDHTNKQVSEVVDIYRLCVDLFDSILESFCNDYAVFRGIPATSKKIFIDPEYNYINTYLEIDLYPDLFTKLWGWPCKPLNWGELLDYVKADRTSRSRAKYLELYANIPKTKRKLLQALKRFRKFSIVNCKNQRDYERFIEFILLPSWYFGPVKGIELLQGEIPNLVYEISELGEKYLENHDLVFSKTSLAEKQTDIPLIKKN